MIKNPCAHIQEERGEKGNRRMKRVSRGAEASREYFRQSTILERGTSRKKTEPYK